MKCPKCGYGGLKYAEEKTRSSDEKRDVIPRRSNLAKCRKCGWKGEA